MPVTPKNHKQEHLYLQQLQKGNKLAWKTFYVAHRDLYIRFARIELEDQEKCYQLIQFCFIELLEKKEYRQLDFNDFSGFRNGVLQFVMNKCKLQLGKRITSHLQKAQIA